jgi:hypothetical protein
MWNWRRTLMGYDADCTLAIDGRTFRGKACLEHKDLTFRGESRLVIPLREIRAIHARDGHLFVQFGDRTAVLSIGAPAAKWAGRIANPPSRLDKLGIKVGMRVALVAVSDDLLEQELRTHGAVIDHRADARDLDMVFLEVRTPADLGTLPVLKTRITPTGVIWLLRVKGPKATVTEAESMAAGKRAGLVDVKVVSVSETHTAEKYVIPVAKRARAARSSSPSPRTRGSASARGRK